MPERGSEQGEGFAAQPAGAVSVFRQDAEVIAIPGRSAAPWPAGRPVGRPASHRICVCRRNSAVSSAPTAISSGASDPGARKAGDSRSASSDVELQIGVEREQHERREVVHARKRHRAREGRASRPSAASRSRAASPRDDRPPNGRRRRSVPATRRACRPRGRATRPRAGIRRRSSAIDDRGAQVVVDGGDGDALRDERRRDERDVALVERAPVAAVEEHERSARCALPAGTGRAFPSGRDRSAGRARCESAARAAADFSAYRANQRGWSGTAARLL